MEIYTDLLMEYPVESMTEFMDEKLWRVVFHQPLEIIRYRIKKVSLLPFSPS